MRFKAYTILELVVVLAVLALMIGLGTAGFIALRQNIQLQQSTAAVVGLFKDAQNSARNSLLSSQSLRTSCSGANCFLADGYAVALKDNKFQIYACIYTIAGSSQVTCLLQNSSSLNLVDPAIIARTIGSPACNGVMFARLSANALAITDTSFGTTSDSGTCNYSISIPGAGSREISVNLDLNNIQLQ